MNLNLILIKSIQGDLGLTVSTSDHAQIAVLGGKQQNLLLTIRQFALERIPLELLDFMMATS